jgi:hypothetical protein
MARKRYNFWLDDKRAEDWNINELITNLKSKGQFTRAIREGLRLWVDLRAGNTAVLIELFPAFKDKLNPPPSAAPAGGGGGHSELAKEIAAQIILQGGTPGYLLQSGATGKPKEIKSPKFDLPVFDDDSDLPTLVTHASTATDAGANLVSSLKGLY